MGPLAVAWQQRVHIDGIAILSMLSLEKSCRQNEVECTLWSCLYDNAINWLQGAFTLSLRTCHHIQGISLHRTRAQEAAQAESLQEREREKELLDLTQLDPGRCEHLGYDRHWNRYWLFGAWGRHSEGGSPSSMVVVGCVRVCMGLWSHKVAWNAGAQQACGPINRHASVSLI